MQALWTLAATFLFTIMGVCVKAASELLPLSQIVVFRGLPSVLVLGAWMLFTHKAFRTPALPMHVKRNGTGVLSMWLGFVALSHLPLATATTLSYTAPLFIVITLFITGRGAMDRGRLMAVALGFLGVLAVLRPTLGDDDWGPAFVGLMSGALAAQAYLQIQALGKVQEPEWRTVFYFSCAATSSGLVMIPWLGWQAPDATGWALLLGCGLSGLAGQFALTRAFGKGSAMLSAALQYSAILFAALAGLLFWAEVPDAMALLGMALIVAAGLLASWRTYRLSQTGRTGA